MNLGFSNITIDGFKSFTNGAQELHLGKLRTGLHLVVGENRAEPRLGPNGAGKSTIFDALFWVLYGRTPDGLRNPDIKPWKGKKSTSVALDLYAGEGRGDEYDSDTLHHIERRTEPNRLLIGNKEVPQEQVTALLGLDMEVFSNTILLGQGQPLFFDLAPRDKMRLFTEVLNLDRWDRRADASAERARNMERELDQVTGELNALRHNRSSLESFLKESQRKETEWVEDQARRLDDYRDRKKRAAKDLERTDEDVKYAERAANVDEKVASMTADVEKSAETISTLVQRRERCIVEVEHLGSELHTAEEQLRKFDQKSVCPTCGQPIKGADIGVHKRELGQTIARIRDKIKKIDTKAYDSDIERERATRDTLRAARDRLVESSLTAKNKYDELLRRAASYRAEVQAMQRRITECEDERNPYTEQVADVKRRIDASDAKEEDLEERTGLLERRQQRAKDWIKGCKDIRLLIIEETLYELELATNALLGEIGLVDWTAKFAIERETKSGTVQRGIDVTIASPASNGAVRWESWSGGERQRLRVVSALALSDVLLARAGVRADLEILDEPTRNMSPAGVRDTCEFLALRAREQRKAVLYVDHSARDSEFFASTITVIKDHNGSRIET